MTTQAERALETDETPVGCVFVHDGEIIGRGMNDTNRSMNVGNFRSLCHSFISGGRGSILSFSYSI